jgi:hypothetical protein
MRLNKETKKAQGLIWSHERANKYTLKDAYTNPSWRKVEAYERWRQACKDLKGTDFRITGASSHFFSLAFKYMNEGKETLVYVTHANIYEIEL